MHQRHKETAFHVGPLVEAYLDAVPQDDPPALIDMHDWRQVDMGVYLHRTQPRALLVQSELDRQRQWPVCMTEEEWYRFTQFLLTHIAWESGEPALSSRPLSEVQVLRMVSYVI